MLITAQEVAGLNPAEVTKTLANARVFFLGVAKKKLNFYGLLKTSYAFVFTS